MELAESRLEQKEQEVSTTYIDLTRHGNRFGGKMKVEVGGLTHEFNDEELLTPRGRVASGNFGANYPEDVILVHPRGGVTIRHGQTGEDILEGSAKIGPARTKAGAGPSPVIVNERVKTSRAGQGLDYKQINMPDEVFKNIKKVINDELNRIVQGLDPKEQAEFIKPENKELRAKYREQAQVVGLKELMKVEDSVRIAAENEAYELLHMIELSRRSVKAGNKAAAIPNVGSGMFAESLYKYVLVVEDLGTGNKKIGFDNIDEIGGFTKQATAFRIIAKRDFSKEIKNKDLEHLEDDTEFDYQFTDPERAKFFEGKKVYLDWDKVRELSSGAKARFNSQHEESK